MAVDENGKYLDVDGILKSFSYLKTTRLHRDMIRRCEGIETLPTYQDCCVSDNFKNIDYFSEWCKNQKGFDKDGWELDKDILYKGNKIYSEDTCCFVPHEINTQFVKSNSIRGDLPIGVTFNKSLGYFVTQVKRKRLGKFIAYSKTPEEAFIKYKKSKEGYIKFLADLYKDDLCFSVYLALINYSVEISD